MADVAVTGVGMVTPLGATARECAAAWLSGRSAERRPLPSLAGTAFEHSPVSVAPVFDAAARLGGRRALKFTSEATVSCCVAAREAMEEAAARQRFAPERIGIFAGVGLAPIDVDDVAGLIFGSIDESGHFSSRLFGERGLPSTNPLVAFRILPNIPPCVVSILEGIKGPSYVLTPWEGQTGAALFEAWTAVADGEVDCALAGASDAAAHPSVFPLLRKMGRLGDDEVPASAAAYVVLERYETARESAPRIHGLLSRVDVRFSGGPAQDPLAGRIGRTLAAAPAILCGLLALTGGGRGSVCDGDGQETVLDLVTA